MNKKLFNTHQSNNVKVANATNHAGGKAYKLSSEEALAQFAMTNCFNGTYYANSNNSFEELKTLVSECSPDVIADIAVYSRQVGHMKDMPAYLLAHLSIADVNLFKNIFNKIIDNGKMLSNFVQIIRSGAVGRKSFGRAAKVCIQKWFESHDAEWLFKQDVGISPKFRDIIRMTHPKTSSKQMNALFQYFLGSEKIDTKNLPSLVKAYEKFKENNESEVPNVPFQLLTALELKDEHWAKIAKNAPWQMTRMNLNTFARHRVFANKQLTKLIAERLANKVEIAKSRVFPYQLMAAYLNVSSDVPSSVKNSLQDAMELATENVPEIEGDVYVCVDTSGSMGSPVTGHNGSATTSMRCIDVASLIGVVLARKVKGEVKIMPFDTEYHQFDFNPRDSIMTTAHKLSEYGGGGTDCSIPLAVLNKSNAKGDLVVYVSDNESWADKGYVRGTGLSTEWSKFKSRNKNARLVCIDLTPNTYSQIENRFDALNIGGFSDQVFKIIAQFVESSKKQVSFVSALRNEVKQLKKQNETDDE